MGKEDKLSIEDKIILTLVGLMAIAAVIGLSVIIYDFITDTEERYCGKVINIYKDEAGYKVSSQRHIVFYNDSLKRNVDVRVSNQQYVNTVIGQRICFDLKKWQLEE